MQSVCLIGQVFLDTLPIQGRLRVRLGGILHAARGLWALNIPFQLCYIAPQYMDDLIDDEGASLEARSAQKLGNITYCPNVLLVNDSREIGAQGYEMLLEPRKQSDINLGVLDVALEYAPSDILIFPGAFDLGALLEKLSASPARVHIDTTEEAMAPTTLARLGRPLETLITSTSTHFFAHQMKGSISSTLEQYHEQARTILLKENRGGSRLFNTKLAGQAVSAPSHTRTILHSVGVGDCYDAAYISLADRHDTAAALNYSSLIAAEYACSFEDMQKFRTASQAVLRIDVPEVSALGGTILPWEARSDIHIYIAAPDFSNFPHPHIDKLCAALTYHNFRPHRPIVEHGEVFTSASPEEKQRVGRLDAALVERCQILLAVLEYDDPGTYVEIGIAITHHIPVLVYDPHHLATNLMITSFAHLISPDVDAILGGVYELAQSIVAARCNA